MKDWEVTLVFAGTAGLTVPAESEKEAIDKAMELADLRIQDGKEACLIEFEYAHELVRGNCLSVSTNESSAEEID